MPAVREVVRVGRFFYRAAKTCPIGFGGPGPRGVKLVQMPQLDREDNALPIGAGDMIPGSGVVL